MVEIIRQILGLSSDSPYYSTLVNCGCTVIIIFTLLISLGLYRLWKYITKY